MAILQSKRLTLEKREALENHGEVKRMTVFGQRYYGKDFDYCLEVKSKVEPVAYGFGDTEEEGIADLYDDLMEVLWTKCLEIQHD